MKTREEIKQEVLDNLTGIAWQKLRSSLLGRELITFGAVVTELNDIAYDTLLKNLNPDQADYTGLAVLAASTNGCYDYTKPTQVVVTAPETCKPFDLCLTIGAIKFYNTQFVPKGDVCVLSAGTIKTATILLREDTEFTYTTNGHKYKKLPKEAQFKSVQLITDTGSRLQAFDEAGNPASVKLWRDEEKNLNVSVLDWGQNSSITITYLLGTAQLPATNKGQLSYLDTVEPWEGQVFEGSETIESARNSYLQMNSEQSAISTKEQIIQAVNEFPQVVDCNPVLNSTGSITVWVKPSIPGTPLETISRYLSLKGEMAVLWKAKEGNPIEVAVVLEALELLSAEQKAEIKEIVSSTASSVRFTTTVTPAWLLSEIGKYNTKVAAYLQTEVTVNNQTQKLPSIPNEGTIYIIQQGKQVAWDSRGVLRGFIGSYNPNDKDLEPVQIGEVFVVPQALQNCTNIFTKEGNLTQVSSAMWDAWNALKIDSSEGWYLLEFEQGYRLFVADAKYSENSDISLSRDPDQAILREEPESGFIQAPEKDGKFNTISPLRILVGSDIYALADSDGTSTLERYRLTPDSKTYYRDFNYPITADSGTKLIFRVDSKVLAVVDDIWVVFSESGQQPMLKEIKEASLNQVYQAVGKDTDPTISIVGLQGNGQDFEVLTKKGEVFTLFKFKVQVRDSQNPYINVISTPKQVAFTEPVETIGFGLFKGESSVYNSQGKAFISKQVTSRSLGQIGVVDYQSATVSFSMEGFEGAVIQSKSSELRQVEQSNYPVIKEIRWQ